MKKLIPYIAVIPMLILLLTPPMDFKLDCTINSIFWLWATFASGFFAFLFLYQKVSVWLKLFVIWGFISCFFSRIPYMSFTMYWSLIICAYYYALCRKIEDWSIVKKSIQSVFFFICLLIIVQLFGKDTLLNFGVENIAVIGTIGNKMISASYACVLTPFLIFTPLNFIPLILISLITTSSGAILSLCAGLAFIVFRMFKRFRMFLIVLMIAIPVLMAYKTGDLRVLNVSGRLPVWKDTVKLSIKNPVGYGIGTYKVLYQYLCSKEVRNQLPGKQKWSKVHNDWLQILFETGFIGFMLIAGWLLSILKRIKNPLKIAGLIILATNMMVHFPMRMVQSAFIILMYLAYCSQDEHSNIKKIKENVWQLEL